MWDSHLQYTISDNLIHYLQHGAILEKKQRINEYAWMTCISSRILRLKMHLKKGEEKGGVGEGRTMWLRSAIWELILLWDPWGNQLSLRAATLADILFISLQAKMLTAPTNCQYLQLRWLITYHFAWWVMLIKIDYAAVLFCGQL